MSNEKTVELEWDSIDSALDERHRDPADNMTRREIAEEVEELRENTPEKDLRVKALEDENMVEFSDISEEELNPNSYSEMKNYGLELLDPDVRGAKRKLEDEREEVAGLREHHGKREDMYNSIRKASRKVRMPSAFGSLVSMPASAGLMATGDPILGGIAAIPGASFFASFPAELASERLAEKHEHHGNYVRTKELDGKAYPLFDAADVVIATREEDRNLFQDEALESYDILNGEAELVQTVEIEDYNPEDEPYAVDLRVDAHPVTGENMTAEPAEEVQYVLVGGEDLEEAYKDMTWS